MTTGTTGTGTTGPLASTVLIAIPARNEGETLEACLLSVNTALDRAVAGSVVERGLIAVCAHRSTDRTETLARSTLDRVRAPADTLVISHAEAATVGEVRSHLIDAALQHWSLPSEDGDDWLFSTDADTAVPADWIQGMLDPAWAALADVVAGMVDIQGWEADEDAKARYAAIIAAGLAPRGHRHVYAANLAVRLRAYLSAGGFPAVEHGEEHGLLQAVRAIGGTVVTPRHPRALTSGRMVGRAEAGLANLLAHLAEPRSTVA